MSELKDAYQLITDSIIKSLEQGVVPWRKTWAYHGPGAYPRNLLTKKYYRGINTLLLMATSLMAKYSSPFWLTFKQCKDFGGFVKKGAKSTPIAFWKFIEKVVKIEDADDLQNWSPQEIQRGEKIIKRKPLLKYYRVFNVEQTEGIPGEKIPVPEENNNDPIQSAEEIVKSYKTMPPITKGEPAYNPEKDIIKMPDIVDFESSEEYYSVLFHEAVHSTGHKSRLNRDGITGLILFGSHMYSNEELIAEIGACFLNLEAGIKAKTIENSTAYIQSWLKKLKNDPKSVVFAAAQAQKAVDYILNIKH